MGLPKIGAVLALDGEKEYKSAITSINNTQKELRSEMKLASEEFYGQSNSIEALTKKQEVLTKQQETQTLKVDVCKTAVEKYSAS
jgi:phage-related minor tail protein